MESTLPPEVQQALEFLQNFQGSFAWAIILVFPFLFFASIILLCRTDRYRWALGILLGAVGSIASMLVLVGAGFAYIAEKYPNEIAAFASGASGGFGMTENENIVTDSTGKISLELFEGWQRFSNLHPGASIQVGDPESEAFLMVLPDLKADYTGSLEDHAEHTSSQLLNNLKKGTRSEPAKIQLGLFHSHPAVRYTLEGTVEDMDLAYHHTTVETPEAFYQIVAWSPRQWKEVSFANFELVADTFTPVVFAGEE